LVFNFKMKKNKKNQEGRWLHQPKSKIQKTKTKIEK
jgi:hypothetical protein